MATVSDYYWPRSARPDRSNKMRFAARLRVASAVAMFGSVTMLVWLAITEGDKRYVVIWVPVLLVCCGVYVACCRIGLRQRR